MRKKPFKKDVEAFLDKNHILYIKGTPERLIQDLQKLRKKLKVKPASDVMSKHDNKSNRQLDLF